MKNFVKRILLSACTAILSLCCVAVAAVNLKTTSASAATALETEFTNNGQFGVDYYTGNTAYGYEFIDGAQEGLPAGYSGAVLKINSESTGGAPYVNLDFTASKIKASNVESVVARVYSPDYTSADELRINNVTGSMGGAGAHNLSTWYDVELPLATITGADGNLGSFAFGLRDKGTISKYFYIDSVTVNVRNVVDVSFKDVHGTWNNYEYDGAYCTFIRFNGGISGNGNLDANFTELLANMTLNGAAVDTTNVKFYCPNWIGSSGGIVMRMGTNPAAGSVLMLPANVLFDIGGTDTNFYNITEDVYLEFDGSKWALTEKPAAGVETAQFTAPWGNVDSYNSADRVLLMYKSTNAWAYPDKGDLVSKVTYKNSTTGVSRAATDADISGWDGQKWIVFKNLAGYDVLEIAEGGTFGGVGIPALTLYQVNGCWVTTAPHAATTNFTKMANGWNNKLGDGISNNIFSFDVNPLGAAADATNLAATINRTSLMVKYNGKTFAELYVGNNKYAISYAHGNNHFYFAIPEADLVDGAIIEIEAGTPFMNNYLGAVKYVFNASTKAWEPYVELEYGTPNFSNATAAMVGAWSWNHQTQNTAVIKDTNYGYTIVADWAIANNATNLASTKNTTSVSITLNGVSFYELYQGDDGYRLNAQLGYFAFSVPTAALVASNGYEYPTLEIVEGTPFYDGNYLPATTLIFKDGAWQLKPEEVVDTTNYNPSFVAVNSVFNNDTNGFFIVQFDTDGWEQGAIPTSYSGISYNGKDITDLVVAGVGIRFYLQSSLWFTYTVGNEKLVAGYNGYSHPTITIAEGATVVHNDKTYTFHAVTFYLVNGAWTTEKPAGYKVTEVVPETPVIPDLGTPDCVFTGIGVWNNENGCTLFEFMDFTNLPTTTESYKATTGYYITLNGKRLSELNGVNVYTWENTYWLRIDVMNPTEGSVLIIEEGAPFAGNYLPGLVFKFVEGKWHQAFTVNMLIGDETFTVYSQNDIPVVIDDIYFENLLADNAIPGKVVSFSTRGVTYGAGTTFKVLTDTTLVVETIGFDTTDGASVRLLTPTGIRYETKIAKADYDALVATYGEANIETGTYIVPKSMLGTTDFRAYFANSAKVDGTDYVKIVNSGWANKKTMETDGYYLYYGSLVDLHPINYGTDFFGIGYIKITDGAQEYIVFGGYNADDFTRSIYYVSSHAYKDYENGSPEQTVLKSYLDSVVYIADDAVISTLIDIDGYTSPYSISYNAVTGVYTVTGNAEIKSVIIGDEKKVDARSSVLLVGGEKYYVTDYDLVASKDYSTLTFKLSPVVNATTLVDFTVEVASNRGVNILQLTDIELTDATQMRTASSLSAAEQTEYARKNIYANAFNYISTMVEQDRPDLIILTGDIVNGAFDDNGSMWLRVIEFMDSFNIPWAPVFGGMDSDSAMGAAWQIAQLASAKNCLFKAGTLGGNGDYTIGITDKGVMKRVIYMLDSNAGAGMNQAQVNWIKTVSASIENCYGKVPAFVFCNQAPATSFAADFKAAGVDGVFMGNNSFDNSSSLSDGIYYTYGTKTGVYGEYDANKVGGTYIEVAANGAEFTITAECLDKTAMENKESIHLVETYNGSSVVTDAYMAPIWETDRIYDETAVFVGETGSVTLMYTPTDPKEVVVRDITLGVTYTYGVDYTISGNKVTRVAGGNLPYRTYEEYYRKDPVVVNGVPQNWRVDTVEDDYRYSGTRYMYYAEAYEGASRHVTFTYDKTEAWKGTKFTGDENAQAFINQLKTEKQGSILFYGDSITVGCNASGTQWGGNRNPFLPSWDNLVTDSLARMYNANITKYNCAVGGWTTAQGAENFTARAAEVGANLADIDLLVLAFGMNDPATEDTKYIEDIKKMAPFGSVLFYSIPSL